MSFDFNSYLTKTSALAIASFSLLLSTVFCGNPLILTPTGTSNFAPGITLTAITLSGVSPVYGLSLGGNTLTLTGTNFSSSVTVQVNGATCSSPTLVSSTQMMCIVPAYSAGSSALGVVNLSISNSVNSTATLQQVYTYLGSPLFWLDASQLATSSTNVTSWTDKSGNGLSPTTLGAPPTYKANAFPNGLPSVAFNGGQCLASATGFPTTSDFTASMVVKQINTANFGNILSDGSNSQHAIFYAMSLNPNLWDAGVYYTVSTIATNLTSFFTITATRQGASPWAGALYVNGQVGGTGNDSSNNPSAQFEVGCFNGNASNLTGEIAEILLYGSLLSSSQRQILESYLRSKYGHY